MEDGLGRGNASQSSESLSEVRTTPVEPFPETPPLSTSAAAAIEAAAEEVISNYSRRASSITSIAPDFDALRAQNRAEIHQSLDLLDPELAAELDWDAEEPPPAPIATVIAMEARRGSALSSNSGLSRPGTSHSLQRSVSVLSMVSTESSASSSHLSGPHNDAAIVIQAWWRGEMDRKATRDLRWDKMVADEEARMAKEAARCSEGLAMLDTRAAEQDLEAKAVTIRNEALARNASASLIQRAWRSRKD